jgi:FAD/FMN-containing dehydrogenase
LPGVLRSFSKGSEIKPQTSHLKIIKPNLLLLTLKQSTFVVNWKFTTKNPIIMTPELSRIDGLKSIVKGPILLPNTPEYDEARAIWNGMFDKKPALIVQCTSISDILECVYFAKTYEMQLAVKGGGHHSAGTSMCDDGIVIDLSLMNNISVNEEHKTITVEGGALLQDVDKESQKYGLVVSAGIVSHTGVGGLTLGGGFGWISRKYGLTIDNLIAVRLITAGGEVITASETENPDLFWAVRGGGGNFGIVSHFIFKAQKVGPKIYCGPIVKKFEDFKEYAKFHNEYVKTVPDELTIWMFVRYAPPLPFIPEEYHGKLVVLLPFAWLGDKADGDKVLEPLRNFGETIGDGSDMHNWVDWQSTFDGLVEHGARNYWKSHHLADLPEDCIDVINEYAQKLPHAECDIMLAMMGGAPSRIPSDATAFPHRNTPFVLNIHTRWREESDDEKCMEWSRGFHKATEPFSKGVYVNFVSDLGEKRTHDAYSDEIWERLVDVKTKWDPNNMFSMNQNIKPRTN